MKIPTDNQLLSCWNERGSSFDIEEAIKCDDDIKVEESQPVSKKERLEKSVKHSQIRNSIQSYRFSTKMFFVNFFLYNLMPSHCDFKE